MALILMKSVMPKPMYCGNSEMQQNNPHRLMEANIGNNIYKGSIRVRAVWIELVLKIGHRVSHRDFARNKLSQFFSILNSSALHLCLKILF